MFGKKDKEAYRRMEYLYNLILAMGRMLKLNPSELHREATDVKSNAVYMAGMVTGKAKKNER